MLNLLILDVFSASRFLFSFNKGMNSLDDDVVTEKLRHGIKSLLDKN